MHQSVGEKGINVVSAQVTGRAPLAFNGFKAPTSNTTYTPNQFFDVVIPNFSRGTVRLVGYLLRKTLGWCDANGNPQEEQIRVSYSELQKRAGISRDMIRSALDDAVLGNLIECVTEGRPKQPNDSGQSAEYQLRWSDQPYTTRIAGFRGFFEGEGNRTDIPNEFFDKVLPAEPLSVIKVVGSIIRHSIGFQARHGRRRQQVALSYQQIANYARFGSRSDLAKALRTALEKNYIVRVEDGLFTSDPAARKPATYAIRWVDHPIGRKNEPTQTQSEKRTNISPISEPRDRSEIRTNIKTKLENETLKGQPAAVTGLHSKLVAIGFSENTAGKLIRDHSQRVIEDQLKWLPERAPPRSPAGLLRRSIEQNWPAPVKLRAPEVASAEGWEFARCFYAGFGGNRGEPVNEPSEREARTAETFVQRLAKVSGHDPDPGEWGRRLGQLAREQRSPFPSLQLAIRQLGDGFLVQIEKKKLHRQLTSITQRRDEHEQTHQIDWINWLRREEATLRVSEASRYQDFIAERDRERSELAKRNTPWSKAALEHFDSDASRLRAFREFFGLPDFWKWDTDINNQSLTTNH